MDIINLLKEKENAVYGKGFSDSEIQFIERKIGLRFANDYREYLKSLGQAIFAGHEISGIGTVDNLDVLKLTIDERAINPNVSDMYVLEKLNFDAIVIWQDSNGTIYETQGKSKPKKIYNSMYEYIEGE